MTKRSTSTTSASMTKPSNLGPLDGAFKLSGDLTKDQATLDKRLEVKNHDAIVRWVKDSYAKCKGQMEPIKRQWYLNLSFHKGDQYVDMIDGRIIKVPAPRNKVRIVVNRIKPVVRTEVSRMTSQEATVEVVPASNEQEDILASQAAQAVVIALRERLQLQRVLRQACWWTSVTGIGYIKCYWDKNLSGVDSNGQAWEGDHCYSSVSPFNVMVPDLLLEDIEEQPYVLNVFTKPIDWVKQNYPEVIKPDFKATVVSANEIMETHYLNTKSSAANDAKPDACLVIEAWVKPGATALLPEGGKITMIDDTIVDFSDKGIPYQHGEYPFAKLESIQTGSFYPSSVIEDLIPVQRELNRTRSQLLEARNLSAKPGWFYTEGSMDPNKVTSAQGQMIGIKPGATPPTPIPLPQMPQYVMELINFDLSDIEDISGQHQVSKGNAPAGVTAGTAIQFLQEADNSFMATTHASIEDAVKKIAKQSIALAVEYWDSQRLVKVVGRDGSISAKYLEGSDIKNGSDIRVEGGSTLPQSKAGRIALFSDLMMNGFLPPQDGLKLMKIPSMQAYWDQVDVDENQALRENVQMSELDPVQLQKARQQVDQIAQQRLQASQFDPATMGDPLSNPIASQDMEIVNEPVVEVNDWDNHDVHIQVIETFMKGQEYQMLDPSVQEEFKLHRQKHLDARVKKMFEDAMKQQMGSMGQPPTGDPNAPAGDGSVGSNQFDGIETPQTVDTAQPPA